MYLETERLIITEFKIEMAEAVHFNSLDEKTRRFLPDEVFETVEEAKETIEFLMVQYVGKTGPFVYPILLKDHTYIGYVQLVKMDLGWEVGYHIASKYRNKGYASEALKAFLGILPLKEVYGICMIENQASICVLEKVGFVKFFEGEGQYQGKNRKICKYRFDCI